MEETGWMAGWVPEIWRFTPVELGSLSVYPIIYRVLYIHPRWLGMGCLPSTV